MNGKTILFTAAHPDDIEFSCGGLINKIYQNNDIYFYIFTKGDKTGSVLERLYETFKIHEKYPKIKIIIDNFNDDSLQQQYNQKNIQISHILNKINADYIFTHYPFDIKKDHIAVSRTIYNYTRNKKIQLIYYESYSIQEMFFKPNYIVEFNWEQKEQLLLNFKSQFHQESLDLAKNRALRNGKGNNIHYAEAYKIVN